jgi:ATP-binding cassette subfamily B protein RaxB
MKPVDLLHIAGGRSGRTPFIQQVEASECGLACIAMVAAHHGLDVDMPTLRRRFSLSLKGVTLKGMMEIAEQIGFNPRPLRGEVHDLDKLALPAVLHWDLNHFVVLTKVIRGINGDRYLIHDPAKGPKKVSAKDLSKHFTGVILELSVSSTFTAERLRSGLRISQLWTRVSGFWPSLQTVLLLSLLLQASALAAPFYLQLAVDSVFPTFDTDLLKMLAIGFGGLALVSMVTSWLRSLLLISLGSSLSYQVVVNLHRHLLRLPLPWFEKRHVGDVLSRFGSTKPISDLLSQGLVAGVVDGGMAFMTLLLMLFYSPLLAGVSVIAWLLFVGIKVASFRVLQLRNVDAITAAALESSTFIESARGIQAIKAFGQETNRQRIWQQRKATAVNAEVELGRLSATFGAASQFVLAIERVFFVYLAVSLAIAGSFTVGMIFAFQAYKQHFLDAGTRLVDQIFNYRLLDVHLARISDIALSPPENNALGTPGEKAIGTVELRSVAFRYGVGEADILRGISLKIEAGEMVALVGPSGQGKTTLLKIMMGLYEPTYGQVVVDGVPLHAIRREWWRRQIGSVSQDDTLYAGSLAENIAFFDPEIDMERVKEVAHQAGIHSEISAMAMGYETLVGDMGSALSGGQKQRVLLARALYPRPSILFIDEGTANLDDGAEQNIVSLLTALPITKIISAHRPRAIEAANRVFFIRNGQAVPVQVPRTLGAPSPPLVGQTA